MFPASIEEMSLIDNDVDNVMPCEHARALFQRLPEMKATNFPNLKKISSTSPIPKDITQAYSAVGVAIINDRRLCHKRNKKGIWKKSQSSSR